MFKLFFKLFSTVAIFICGMAAAHYPGIMPSPIDQYVQKVDTELVASVIDYLSDEYIEPGIQYAMNFDIEEFQDKIQDRQISQ